MLRIKMIADYGDFKKGQEEEVKAAVAYVLLGKNVAWIL